VGDEVLARAAALIGMPLAGEGKGALDRRAVEVARAVGAVLADDREKVAEQRAVLGRKPTRDLVDRRRGSEPAIAGADPRVSAPVGGRGRLGRAVLVLVLA
jgi:hypothetical protein